MRVTTSEVDVWRDDVTWRHTIKRPYYSSSYVATAIEASIVGAEFAEVTLEVRPASGGASLYREEQSCVNCMFSVDDTSVMAGPDFDVVIAATGWGKCPTSGAPGPCAPPRTLRISRGGVQKR